MAVKNYINFRKTSSVEFAQKFPWFSVWLMRNAETIDVLTNKSVLKTGREREIPLFPELRGVIEWNRDYIPVLGDIVRVGSNFFRVKKNGEDGDKPLGYFLYNDDDIVLGQEGFLLDSEVNTEFYEVVGENVVSETLGVTWFLDDIKIIYFRGVPYECPSDFLTGVEYSDEVDGFVVDSERHILLVPVHSYSDVDDGYKIVTEVHQDHTQIRVVHKEIGDVRLKGMKNEYISEFGVRDGDTLSDAMSKINDSIVWIDMEDDPSVFTSNDGTRMMYSDGWYVLTNL